VRECEKEHASIQAHEEVMVMVMVGGAAAGRGIASLC
jgi:hypothetical protein